MEMQFTSAVAATLVSLPVLLFADLSRLHSMSSVALGAMLLNGVTFHYQSLAAWHLMSFVSPVTHSVANTVKRALAIWLSVLVFHNSVTRAAWFGSALVFGGVVLYQRAKTHSERKQ